MFASPADLLQANKGVVVRIVIVERGDVEAPSRLINSGPAEIARVWALVLEALRVLVDYQQGVERILDSFFLKDVREI